MTTDSLQQCQHAASADSADQPLSPLSDSSLPSSSTSRARTIAASGIPYPHHRLAPRSSVPPMVDSAIPDISWRLIMHSLSIRERLQLTRCSTTLMRAACSPFAWSGVTLPISTESSERLALLSAGRVLRHIPLSLSVHSRTTFAHLFTLLNGVLSRAVLRELDTRECAAELAWAHILAHPQMTHLRVLHLSGLSHRSLVTPAMAHLIAALPSLEALHMSADALPLIRHCETLLPSSFSSLRALHLTAPWPFDVHPNRVRLHTLFSRICPAQTSLSFDSPPLSEYTFLPTFTAPHMRWIQRLRLSRISPVHRWGQPAVPISDVAPALAHLSSMHTLVLDRCEDPILWMRNMQHAPVLQTLELICAAEDGDEALRRLALFSVQLFESMLSACAKLHCRWTLQTPPGPMCEKQQALWISEKQRYREDPTLLSFGRRWMMMEGADLRDDASQRPQPAVLIRPADPVGYSHCDQTGSQRKKNKCVLQ